MLGNGFVYGLLRRYETKIVKKQPTLEVSELACGRQGFSARKINQQ
jgi:hypothetical protein